MVCLELNWSKFVRGQLVLSLRDWSGAVGVLYPLEVGQDGGHNCIFFQKITVLLDVEAVVPFLDVFGQTTRMETFEITK